MTSPATPAARPLKVAMLMTDLDDLGVQRVVINLYHHLDRDLIEPMLILWKKEGRVAQFLQSQEPVYETDHGLRRPRLFFRLFRYLRLLRSFRPDVILSFVPVTNVSVAMLRPFLPRTVGFVACEHAFISRAFAVGEYYGAFRVLYRALLRPMYNRIVDALVMTAEVGKQDAIESWGIKKEKISVIYNPQDLEDLRKRVKEPLDDEWFNSKSVPILVAAGRLTKQKGFDSLLRAFAKLLQRRPARLAILGRGELEDELRRLVGALGITDSVRFLGFQSNHLKYIGHADLFVLSSVWEAMPMVLAETMAVGTPIVSFDCPSGPREMLDGGECGFLVPDQDVQALADTMAHALDHPEESRAKAARAEEKVKRFDVRQVVEEYRSLLFRVAASRKERRGLSNAGR